MKSLTRLESITTSRMGVIEFELPLNPLQNIWTFTNCYNELIFFSLVTFRRSVLEFSDKRVGELERACNAGNRIKFAPGKSLWFPNIFSDFLRIRTFSSIFKVNPVIWNGHNSFHRIFPFKFSAFYYTSTSIVYKFDIDPSRFWDPPFPLSFPLSFPPSESVFSFFFLSQALFLSLSLLVNWGPPTITTCKNCRIWDLARV